MTTKKEQSQVHEKLFIHLPKTLVDILSLNYIRCQLF